MSDVMTLPASVEPKCRIEEVFDQSFIELLRLVPLNPYVRALILKLTGKMPPEECETFEQIQAWVGSNCEKRRRPAQSHATRSAGDDGISINVEFSEMEYGRADYSVYHSGTESFFIGAEELMEMVQAAVDEGEGIDGLVERVAGKIDDDAWNECEPDMENYGDYDYNDHEATDSDNSATDYSKNEIRDAVLAFVRTRHPELAAEL
jgi:hypothetical protein